MFLYSEMFNWNFNLNNKNYSIYLRDYIGENKLYLSMDKINWTKIEIPDKNKLIYNFMYDNYSFSIKALINKKYELFINSFSFDKLKQINNNLNLNETAFFGKNEQNYNDNNNNIFNNINQNFNYDNLSIHKKENKNNFYFYTDKKNYIKKNNINHFSYKNNHKNKSKFIKNNINNINNFENIINNNIKNNSKPSRNKKPKIEYQSSDELLKKAIIKEKKTYRNLANYYSNDNFKSKLPKFAEHLPKSIYHVYQYNNKNMEKQCAICLCNFVIGQEIVTLPCFHFFHCNCISNWLIKKRICPICTSPIQILNIMQ